MSSSEAVNSMSSTRIAWLLYSGTVGAGVIVGEAVAVGFGVTVLFTLLSVLLVVC